MQLLAEYRDATLSIRVAHDDDTYLVALYGELDCKEVDLLRRELQRAEASSARAIVVDLGALQFIDSSGLEELLEAQRRSSSAGDRLELLRGPRHVQRVFALAGVTDRFRFVG